MQPDLQMNDILIIDPESRPTPGNFVAAKLEDDNSVIIRRYKQISAMKNELIIELVATNDTWANIRVDNQDKSKMIGSVVSLIRQLKV